MGRRSFLPLCAVVVTQQGDEHYPISHSGVRHGTLVASNLDAAVIKCPSPFAVIASPWPAFNHAADNHHGFVQMQTDVVLRDGKAHLRHSRRAYAVCSIYIQ